MPDSLDIKNKIHFLTRYYIDSDEKLKALLLLSGALICTASYSYLKTVAIPASMAIGTGLEAMDKAATIVAVIDYSKICAYQLLVVQLQKYLIKKLSINWRDWLTSDLRTKYISYEQRFLEISRLPAESRLNNPEQRINDEVKTIAKQTLLLGLSFLDSLPTLITSALILWRMSGSINFMLAGMNIAIPGSLVWVGLIYTALNITLTMLSGKQLGVLKGKLSAFEADHRNALEMVHTQAESIALEHSESYYSDTLKRKFHSITEHANKLLRVDVLVGTLISLSQQIVDVAPMIAALPGYFSGKLTLAQFYQVSIIFSTFTAALNWVADSFVEIAEYNASFTRLMKLDKELQSKSKQLCDQPDKKLHADKISIHRNSNTPNIEITNLTVFTPQSPSVSATTILRGINLVFKPGEHTLIKAESGLGKSTLFKVLSGTWKFGRGLLQTPQSHTMCFLPQQPLFPQDSLRAILAYPDPVSTYTEEQYREVLQDIDKVRDKINHEDSFVKDLENTSWSPTKLSGGQRQLISFARVLLKNKLSSKRPKWLFLDEATSALDLVSEEKIYRFIREQLKNTTIISIAHRDTLTQFHNRVITFRPGSKDKNTVIEDVPTNTESAVTESVFTGAVLTTVATQTRTASRNIISFIWEPMQLQLKQYCCGLFAGDKSAQTVAKLP